MLDYLGHIHLLRAGSVLVIPQDQFLHRDYYYFPTVSVPWVMITIIICSKFLGKDYYNTTVSVPGQRLVLLFFNISSENEDLYQTGWLM
jgi:hypothetical protein